MTTITFYSTTPVDQQRFAELFAGTDFQCEFVSGSIDHQHSNADAAVISIFVGDQVTAEIMDSMPKLKLIATRSTGFDHIDLEAAQQRGITVVTVPRYGETTVAEYTFALLLSLSRKIAAGQQAITTGTVDTNALCGFDLHDKTIGLIGTGKIGLHVAMIAKGFGMNIIAYDPYPNEAKAQEIGFEYIPLETLAERSDVLSLHAPATPENHHLVDSTFLKRVKSSAVLINTARGELVDTAALLQHLQSMAIGGAGLDVLEYEAHLKGSVDESDPNVQIVRALQALPNVILTPHNAFNTHEAVDRIRQTTAQNIIDFYKGKTPNKVEG